MCLRTYLLRNSENKINAAMFYNITNRLHLRIKDKLELDNSV